jgi:hypothetical protein
MSFLIRPNNGSCKLASGLQLFTFGVTESVCWTSEYKFLPLNNFFLATRSNVFLIYTWQKKVEIDSNEAHLRHTIILHKKLTRPTAQLFRCSD